MKEHEEHTEKTANLKENVGQQPNKTKIWCCSVLCNEMSLI